MAKQGMQHSYTKQTKSAVPPVPEINGKAKSSKAKARPLIAEETNGKVYHTTPPLRAFGAIDNDLAIENMENDFDMTAADMQDLRRQDV